MRSGTESVCHVKQVYGVFLVRQNAVLDASMGHVIVRLVHAKYVKTAFGAIHVPSVANHVLIRRVIN